MDLRPWLSRLGYAQDRRSATHGLVVVVLLGIALTLLLLLATGRGARWFFALTVWLALIFVPLWLLLQAFQTLGPALRRRAATAAETHPDRYRRPGSSALVVDELFERHVVMPRIATPVQAQKAREAAVVLVARANRRPDPPADLRAGLTRCLAAVDGWVRETAAWAEAKAADNIQARWEDVRALAALGAFARALLAVYEDRVGPGAGWLRHEGHSISLFLDAVLDYCDDLALEVDVRAWAEPPLGLPEGREGIEELRQLWITYLRTGHPAPGALNAFVGTLIPA